ncbi:conserved membrane hypothetical protein [Candidatus Zixiibacteriota bacterium]|nr:conserved membrane hypothetical protein [candidate division Zixibacteria bacterium]
MSDGINQKAPLLSRLKTIIIGGARNPQDPGVFHKLSLIAFFAWIGLGADGLSSSCYGPAEAFQALGQHSYLGIFVALGSVLTIFIISASYSHIIELFPTGGGGYLVASKLLSPTFGMISGCALIIDYVLTISLSIASGAEAIFSFLPTGFQPFILEFAILSVIIITLINLRGVKESVMILMPIFMLFVVGHLFAITYSIVLHFNHFPSVVSKTADEIKGLSSQIGYLGVFVVILRAYSMGAGTFTGIEAVSNGLPVLREPREQTGKRTMKYMAYSLAIMVLGLMVSYMLFDVAPESGRTLNAVLFSNLTEHWGKAASDAFIWIILLSEGAILFVAAQTGFVDGPRVLANMALDRWFPTKFASLSDRLVTKNGILLMGGAATILMILTKGSVQLLLVLYSINVFITFVLSQTGMVRHWWQVRREDRRWRNGFLINGIGLILCAFILISVVAIKFHEGGWITMVITFALVVLMMGVKRHYKRTHRLLRRLDNLLVTASEVTVSGEKQERPAPEEDPNGKTAVLLVNGYNGLGLHSLFSIFRTFKGVFKNFVFIQVGVVDAGVFKGRAEVENLRQHIDEELKKYIHFMNREGYYAEGVSSVGIDVIDEIEEIGPPLLKKYPDAVFFGGQIVFPEEKFFTRWLHNYVVFAVQRRFYHRGIPFIILPIRA